MSDTVVTRQIGRVKMVEFEEKIEVIAPARRHWMGLVTTFCSLVATSWFAVSLVESALLGKVWGEVVVISALWSSSLIAFVWNCSWFLWGYEIAEFANQDIHLRRQAGLFSSGRRFSRDCCHSARVRTGDLQHGYWSHGPKWWSPFADGRIEFECSKTGTLDLSGELLRFGSAISPSEAKEIVAVIVKRFPHLAS